MLVLAKNIEDIIGIRFIISGAGGCVLRLPFLYGYIPDVLFGPAVGMIHGKDEYVEFEQVINCSKILALIAIG